MGKFGNALNDKRTATKISPYTNHVPFRRNNIIYRRNKELRPIYVEFMHDAIIVRALTRNGKGERGTDRSSQAARHLRRKRGRISGVPEYARRSFANILERRSGINCVFEIFLVPCV